MLQQVVGVVGGWGDRLIFVPFKDFCRVLLVLGGGLLASSAFLLYTGFAQAEVARKRPLQMHVLDSSSHSFPPCLDAPHRV